MTFLPEETMISMNFWGFTPDVFEDFEIAYKQFLENANLEKDEIYISDIISQILEDGSASVKVLKTDDKWYGITYRADLKEIKNAIGQYIENGLYEGIE